jgi:hypothetical protein
MLLVTTCYCCSMPTVVGTVPKDCGDATVGGPCTYKWLTLLLIILQTLKLSGVVVPSQIVRASEAYDSQLPWYLIVMGQQMWWWLMSSSLIQYAHRARAWLTIVQSMMLCILPWSPMHHIQIYRTMSAPTSLLCSIFSAHEGMSVNMAGCRILMARICTAEPEM